MLFLSPIKKKLNALDNELTLPLLSHIQKVVQHVSEHAMELASHCGRKNVSVKDVAQASSGLCLTCAPYDANENTCKLITSSTLQKGLPVCHRIHCKVVCLPWLFFVHVYSDSTDVVVTNEGFVLCAFLFHLNTMNWMRDLNHYQKIYIVSD